MEMVTAIVCRQNATRMTGIPDGSVEVDHRVKLRGSTDPKIHPLSLGLSLDGEVVLDRGALKRGQSSTEYSEALLVRTLDELRKACLDFFGTHLFTCRRSAAGMPDVIDSKQHDDVAYPWLCQHILVETSQR